MFLSFMTCLANMFKSDDKDLIFALPLEKGRDKKNEQTES